MPDFDIVPMALEILCNETAMTVGRFILAAQEARIIEQLSRDFVLDSPVAH
jgi:hypothetical protein